MNNQKGEGAKGSASTWIIIILLLIIIAGGAYWWIKTKSDTSVPTSSSTPTLSDAMIKAKNVSIKAALTQIQGAAERLYDANPNTPKSYDGLDADTPAEMIQINQTIIDDSGSLVVIEDNISYCAKSVLNGGGEWCVDSTGYRGNSAFCAAGNIACTDLTP